MDGTNGLYETGELPAPHMRQRLSSSTIYNSIIIVFCEQNRAYCSLLIAYVNDFLWSCWSKYRHTAGYARDFPVRLSRPAEVPHQQRAKSIRHGRAAISASHSNLLPHPDLHRCPSLRSVGAHSRAHRSRELSDNFRDAKAAETRRVPCHTSSEGIC